MPDHLFAGTGKSQFLKYASKVTPRSVLTTGIGSTSAGLTVTAVKVTIDIHLLSVFILLFVWLMTDYSLVLGDFISIPIHLCYFE